MDTKQLEYIIKIAEENNITRAAEKLFITQSALNQQLLKLEKELGLPLFVRSRTNWCPTKAGELYIENAKKMLQIKKETYNIISDMAEINRGTLTVGFTPGRGIHMFTSVYPKFHKAFPDIKVEPIERSTHELQSMISDQTIDIAFFTLREEDQDSNCYIDLIQEEILLAIPKAHPLSALAAAPGEKLATLELSAVKDEPFVLMNKTSTMRTLVNDLFEEAEFTPKVLFETRNNDTILKMIKTNLCCGLIPSYYAKRAASEISFFALPSHPYWKVAAAYKKNTYLNKASKHFIQLVKEIWTTES